MSRADYMRKYREKKRGVTRNSVTPLQTGEGVTHVTFHPEVDLKLFEGKGRGVPVNGFVLISKRSEPNGNTEHAIVTESDWRERINKRCDHELYGWSCKECLDASQD